MPRADDIVYRIGANVQRFVGGMGVATIIERV